MGRTIISPTTETRHARTHNKLTAIDTLEDFLSVDTETTGIDPWHSSRPFLVTTCDINEESVYWEWHVDPLTRKPIIPEEDVQELQEHLSDKWLIFHNAKFDYRMLSLIGIQLDWGRIYDTVRACHLLESSRSKDLEAAVLTYTGADMTLFEERMQQIILQARRMAKKEFPDWRIAKADEPDMPSIKPTSKKIWKNDSWLPRAIYKAARRRLKIPKTWDTVTATYANADGKGTFLLFQEVVRLLQRKDLWEIYIEALKADPIAYDMEEVGITINENRRTVLLNKYKAETNRSGAVCLSIAEKHGCELELPKSGNNKSLLDFIFYNPKGLQIPIKFSTKKGNPELDKLALEHYIDDAKEYGDHYRFLRALRDKRKRDTAINYLEGYRRYMLPYGDNPWFILHPSLNPTGSTTLRWSSQNPNEQNISKQEGFNLRYAFGPAPGREWWSLDYDNLELRIPAYECQEPAMLELFENPESPPYYGSYHLLIFSILYPKEFRKFGSDVKTKYKSTLYQWTKNGNFAELYGAIDTGDGKSTADKAFHYPGAQGIVAERLKKKAELNDKYVSLARHQGYVETLPDKTINPRRGYPLHFRRGRWNTISPTEPLNYHVQGTACWVILRAMIKVKEYLDTLPGYNLIMQVHDELVFDFPYKKHKRNLPIIKKIKKLMESCGDDIDIPLTCGIDYHPKTWSLSV